jgi:hypothetical protein
VSRAVRKPKKPKATTRLPDDAVLKFLGQLDPKVAVSAALKRFRAAGKSCSQERFRQLMKKRRAS